MTPYFTGLDLALVILAAAVLIWNYRREAKR